MTVEQFFSFISQKPALLITYFIALPAIALLLWLWGEGKGHKPPLNYVYSVLVYLVCVPGILAFTFNIYLFLFERASIYQMNIYTQIFPILSMILTLVFIRKNVEYQYIPGFSRLSTLLLVIGAIMMILWFLHKTHIFAVTTFPIMALVLVFFAALAVIMFGTKKVFK